MSMRSIGKLTVAFGLVSIPVKLYSATSAAEGIKFNLLDKTGSRLKQQYINSSGAVVERADMVKGYEFAKDQYVMFTAEELKAMEEAGSHTADILEFVPAESIDPVYFDKPYYLAPDVGGAKSYALVARALHASNRVALGKWASRGKGHVVMIRVAEGGALVMQQLLYANEVRAVSDLGLPKTEVNPKELALAMQLIEAQSVDGFNPAQFKDEVAARVLAAVEKKVAGEEFTIAATAAPTAQVIDLAAALTASLARKSAKQPAADKAAAEKPTAAPKTAKGKTKAA